MRIDNLSGSALQHVQSQIAFKRVSFLNTPYSEVFKLRLSGEPAAAVEIQHPGFPERPAGQESGSGRIDFDSHDWLRNAPGHARRTHGNLAPERVLHLLR